MATEQLSSLQGRVAMVDGGFDPIHGGHIDYFREAAALGAPVLCNVSPDLYVERKHPPFLPQDERTKIIDAIRYVDYTHPSKGSTANVLRALRPLYYVKGADWADRLPGEESTICSELGIEIVYLETVLNSSTGILQGYVERWNRN